MELLHNGSNLLVPEKKPLQIIGAVLFLSSRLLEGRTIRFLYNFRVNQVTPEGNTVLPVCLVYSAVTYTQIIRARHGVLALILWNSSGSFS